MSIADKIAARVNSIAGPPAEASGSAGDAADAPHDGGAGAAPPAGDAATPPGASREAQEDTSGAPDDTSADPPAAPQADPAAEARRKEFEEKLAAQRARQQARREREQARLDREQAEADRKAAADERAKWEAARKDYRKAFQELGLSPREVYEEMTRQAIEANTPEAQINAMQAAWKTELQATVEPLKKTIEQLQAEKAEYARQVREGQLVSAYQSVAGDPAYVHARAEYGDSEIIDMIRTWDETPEAFYRAAETYGVAVANPGRGFSMREALNVIRAAHEDYDRGREQRRARLLQPKPSPADQQSAPPTSTVNGTAARTNAGTTISNDLASTRASSGRPKLTRKQRVDAIIERTTRR